MVEVVIPYSPRSQFVSYHDRTERFAKIVAHRRFGKTVGCINDKIKAALTNTRQFPPPRYSYIAPTYAQAKDVAWGYLKHFSAPIPGIEIRESELSVVYPNNAIVRLYGADNYDRMRGLYNDGVTVDEPAQMDPRAWPEVIRPTLSDYNGWATFIGTPAGRDWFYKVDREEGGLEAPGWFRLVLKASETGIIAPEELRSLRAGLTEEQYAQEFECSFEAAVIGAYYGKLMQQAEQRITGVPFEPSAQVFTAWDLGIEDSTAIWFAQVVGREIRLIDYYEASGVDLGHYVREIFSRPYVYGGHIVPHDAQAKELGTGKTRLEVLASLGLKDMVVAPMHRVEDGINAVRVLLPRCWFDARKCHRGIEALKLYHAEFDNKLGTLKPKPVHDWCFVGETEVLTSYGTCQIMNLPKSGEVLTPCGWRQYVNPRITRRNAQLVEVRFTDGLTVKCTPDHMFMTENGWKSAQSLSPGLAIQSTLTLPRSIGMALSTVFGRAKRTLRTAAVDFIERFGRPLSALFPRAVISTIGTTTHQITCCQTWSAFQPSSISQRLGRGEEKRGPQEGTSLSRRETPPKTGTNQRQGGYGTVAMPSALKRGQSGSASLANVRTAAIRLMHLFGNLGILKSIVQRPAKSVRIASVRELAETADVWCVTVPDSECFSLSNGAVVHNCSHSADAFRYLAFCLDGLGIAQSIDDIFGHDRGWADNTRSDITGY